MSMKEKPYFVADQWTKKVIYTTSPRKACEEFIRQTQYKDNPKLCKMYNDGPMGEVFHTGYVCGKSWMSVGEVSFLRVKA